MGSVSPVAKLAVFGFFPQSVFSALKSRLKRKSKTTRVLNELNNIIIDYIPLIWKERNRKWDEHIRNVRTKNITDVENLVPLFNKMCITPPSSEYPRTPTNKPLSCRQQRKAKRNSILLRNKRHDNTPPVAPSKLKITDTLSPKISKIASSNIKLFEYFTSTPPPSKKRKQTSEDTILQLSSIKTNKKQKTLIKNFTYLIEATPITPINALPHDFPHDYPPEIPNSPIPPPYSPYPSPPTSPRPSISNSAQHEPLESPPSSPLIDKRKKRRSDPPDKDNPKITRYKKQKTTQK